MIGQKSRQGHEELFGGDRLGDKRIDSGLTRLDQLFRRSQRTGSDDDRSGGLLLDLTDHSQWVAFRKIEIGQDGSDLALVLQEYVGCLIGIDCDEWFVAVGFQSVPDDFAGILFIVGHEHITGVVERIDPLNGLSVRTASGSRFLAASTASLVH